MKASLTCQLESKEQFPAPYVTMPKGDRSFKGSESLELCDAAWFGGEKEFPLEIWQTHLTARTLLVDTRGDSAIIFDFVYTLLQILPGKWQNYLWMIQLVVMSQVVNPPNDGLEADMANYQMNYPWLTKSHQLDYLDEAHIFQDCWNAWR